MPSTFSCAFDLQGFSSLLSYSLFLGFSEIVLFASIIQHKFLYPKTDIFVVG